MFAYCNNNPVIFADQYGFSLHATTTRINDGGSGYTRFPPIPVPIDPVTFGDALSGVADWVGEKVDELMDAISKSFARAKTANYNSEREDHHIVAENATKAAPARAILEEVLPGGVENPINHIYIKTGLHRRIHRNIYYEDIVNTTIVVAYQTAGGNQAQATANVSTALIMLAGVMQRWMLQRPIDGG